MDNHLRLSQQEALADRVDMEIALRRERHPQFDALMGQLLAGGHVGILGEACRAWWLGHPFEERLSLVTDIGPSPLVHIVQSLNPLFLARNVGGWKFFLPGLSIDISALSEIDALRIRGRIPTFRALAEIAALDWDALVVIVDRHLVFEDGWFEAIQEGRVDLRYPEEAYGPLLAGKALALCRAHGAFPTPRLRDWIRIQQWDSEIEEHEWRRAQERYAPDLDLPAFFAALRVLASDA